MKEIMQSSQKSNSAVHLKILIHTQFYPPEMGAPQARLSDLARRLQAMGHSVEILTAIPNYPTGKLFQGYPRFSHREVIDGIPVTRSWIIPSAKPSLLHRLVSYFSFMFSSLVAGLFLKRSFDIVITESPPLFLAFSGWLLSRIKGAKWIMNISDLWPDSAIYVGILSEKDFVYRVLKRFEHFLYRRASLVTGQSREIVGEIKRQVPEVSTYHLSNGVDVENFSPARRDEEVRKSYIREGEVGFVYAGLHGLFQGLDQIIAAAGNIDGTSARFVLIGDGPVKKDLMQDAKSQKLSNVDFHDPIPHRMIPLVIASLDVAVITLKSSIRGAVPSKIYEAMASGVPILLVATGEATEIVRNAGCGLIVAPGDIEGLVKAIRELAGNAELRASLGKAGRQAAVSFYDRQQIASRFNDALIKL
ncbi:MAG: glycosyltransferase family 4 protein [Smithella sp.]|nr:glycosyltransferase family 4 protein [Smithella sp.]